MPDIVFKCTSCSQELSVPPAGAGVQIECPTCGAELVVPTPPPAMELNPINASAAAKEDKHFVVPQRASSENLIQKPSRPLEVTAKETDKKLRIKTIKRSECIEVGKDHFDEIVSKFLGRLPDGDLMGLHVVHYDHQDHGGQHWVADYGVMIVYKG